MSPRLALCFLTCDRYDYTDRTLTSLARFTDLRRFDELIHVDDGSEDVRVPRLVDSIGFDTVLRNPVRTGIMECERALAREAARRACDWTLLLQNDWEWVRGFPWLLFDHIVAMSEVYCLRLYGEQKGMGHAAGSKHQGRGGADAGWRLIAAAPEAAEIGCIHWGSPPAVTRTDLLTWLLDGAARDRDARVKSGQLSQLTVRVVENVVYHIGAVKTPGYRK